MYKISVSNKKGFEDFRGANLKKKALRWLGINIDEVKVIDCYLVDCDLIQEEVEMIKKELLVDPVSQKAFQSYSQSDLKNSFDWIIQVGFKPGVKDTKGERTIEAIRDLINRKINGNVYTCTEYILKGNLSRKEVEKLSKELLANELIHRIKIFNTKEVDEEELKHIPEVKAFETKIKTFDPENLKGISEERNLALSEEDLEVIKNYFQSERVLEERKKKGLPEKITDVELEAIAQTQSEHCRHKIFNAKIHYKDKATGSQEVINSLFETYIKRSTQEINPDWVLSVFWDNAGVIEFNKDYAVSMKFETHNSPSAKGPYEGAITGIVGVYRDPMGAGKGSRIIAGSYGFCTPDPFYNGKLKPEMGPKRLLEGIVEGVRDGGNKSGVPTIFGYSKYDNSFLGKPLVHVGALGLMPKEIQGEKCFEKDVKAGDLIVSVGGRVGRDGIHGVTEASLEFGEHITPGHVQIGDPFTQKKVHDFLIEARDNNLYKLVWDCGGGGLSSAVGETAKFSNGCELNLEKVPLKYQGLNPWEILVSESQERMILGVRPEKFEEIKKLAEKHDVEISKIGEYKDHGKFHVKWKGKSVAYLDMKFLHEGFPQLNLNAEWSFKEIEEPVIKEEDHNNVLRKMIKRINIASKEWIQRQYDHEVQGTCIIKPFVGKQNDVDSDASVIKPIHNSNEGLALSLGNCFKYSAIDTYWMAACSLDEAIRRVLAVGASLDRIAINDNFCWPNPIYDQKTNPDGKEKLGKLVRACKALYKFTKAFHTPCISGKDSMFINGNIKGEDGKVYKVSGLPSLQFAALGKVKNIKKCVDLSVKREGDLVYILGETKDELGASEFYEMNDKIGKNVPKVNEREAWKVYKVVSKAIDKELLNSCHGCYRGGLAIALAKKAFAGELGMKIELKKVPSHLEDDVKILYSESPSRFVVTLDPRKKEAVENLFEGIPHSEIGRVGGKNLVIIGLEDREIINIPVKELKREWKSVFKGF